MVFPLAKLFAPKSTGPKKISQYSITDVAKIGPLLKRLADEHGILTIKLEAAEQAYSSVVLDVNCGQKTFLLDELTPTDGHKTLLSTKSLYIEGQVDGADLSFNASLLKVITEKGIISYEMQIPEQVEYIQRRSTYRVRLKAQTKTAATIYDKETKAIVKGTVVDISIGGISLLFDRLGTLHCGEVLQLCKIMLSDDTAISVDLEVCHVKMLPKGRSRLGCRFANLDKNTKREIEKFVRQAERQNLQNNI